jgi:hypothetical protein
MHADRVMFFKLGHKLLAVALHKDHVVAKQFADTGYWFDNTLNQLQLDKKLFWKLPVVEMDREFVNFK